MLLLVFMITYPLSIHLQNGIWGNVIVPTILSMALLGLENVADFMENPFGDDSADISVYEFVHALEVEVQNAFDLSEGHHGAVLDSWEALGEHFRLGKGVGLLQPRKEQEARRRSFRFTDFFEWNPLPLHTVQYITQQSSEVTSYHTNLVASTCIRPEAVDDESDAELLAAQASQHDVFLIRLCLSLRNTEQQQLQNAKQHKNAVLSSGISPDMNLMMNEVADSHSNLEDWSMSCETAA